MSYIDQGFKITVNDGNKTITKELNKKDFDDISFIGEYPIAFVEYAQKETGIACQSFCRILFAIHSTGCQKVLLLQLQ